MSIADRMPLAEVKNRLSEVVDKIQREHGRLVITKHGRPAAVMLSMEDLESLEETLDILGNASLLAAVRESLQEFEAGPATVLTKEEALRLATGPR